MPTPDHSSTFHGDNPEVRLIRIGGRSGGELLADLISGGIQLNEYAKTLLASGKFQTSRAVRPVSVVVVSVRDLGFSGGAGFGAIVERALERKLSLCPVELGPHLRLQYLDQPEGFIGHPVTQHRAPPGSITVASEPLDSDAGFPKGFYLRCIEGALWLRGYCCDDENIWRPEDRLAFCRM